MLFYSRKFLYFIQLNVSLLFESLSLVSLTKKKTFYIPGHLNFELILLLFQCTIKGSFPGASAGKESACNAGGQSSIPGLGRSPGEGKGNPL